MNKKFLGHQRIRHAITRMALLISIAGLLGGCSSIWGKMPPPTYNENILSIVADLRLNAHDDIYQFPYPVDLTGQNIYKATLVRVANFENLYPDKYRASIAYMKGVCHERLGDYALAIANFEQAAREDDPILTKRAEARVSVLRDLNDVILSSGASSSLEELIRDANDRIQKLKALKAELDQTTFTPIVDIEIENAEVYLCLMLKNNRYVIDKGMERTLEAMNKLVEEQGGSKNSLRHYLMLGDFYFELAREYVYLNPPETHMFNWDEFEKLIVMAQNIYYTVEKADGFAEKLEGRYMLQAALAFAQSVRRKSY